MTRRKELVYKVGMPCGGCSNAIQRILNKIEGVEKVECDVSNQEVRIEGDVEPDAITEKLSKWSEASGNKVELLEVKNI